jgi:ribosome biogenesis protein MAK21
MKSIIVREIVALVLRPVIPAPTSTSPSTSLRHIRFTDNAKSTKPKPKDKAAVKGVNAHARYYATITFNQIVLRSGSEDKEVARNLIDVYFEMFKEIIGEIGADDDDSHKKDDDPTAKEHQDGKGKKKGKSKGKQTSEAKGAAGFAEVEDSNSRLVSAILTGVNRALPFAKIDAGDSVFVSSLLGSDVPA